MVFIIWFCATDLYVVSVVEVGDGAVGIMIFVGKSQRLLLTVGVSGIFCIFFWMGANRFLTCNSNCSTKSFVGSLVGGLSFTSRYVPSCSKLVIIVGFVSFSFIRYICSNLSFLIVIS